MADAAGDDLDALGMDPAQFEALEADFDSVLSELGADGTLEQFKLEYETLFRALKKSNESEKRLMKKCRELSADIGAASAKCAAATKLSGEDQGMIQQLKKDIERTWASVEASHEKEAAAKAQLAELRGEIDTLRRSVEQGAGSSVAQEGRLRELAATRDELCRERDAQAQQVQQARSIIAELAEKLRTLESEKAAAEAAVTEQTAAIEQKKVDAAKELKRKERLEKEMRELKEVLEERQGAMKEKQKRVAAGLDESGRVEQALREQKATTDRALKEVDGLTQRVVKLQVRLGSRPTPLPRTPPTVSILTPPPPHPQHELEEHVALNAGQAGLNDKLRAELTAKADDVKVVAAESVRVHALRERVLPKIAALEKQKGEVDDETARAEGATPSSLPPISRPAPPSTGRRRARPSEARGAGGRG